MGLQEDIHGKQIDEQLNVCLNFALGMALIEIPESDLLTVQGVLWRSVGNNMNFLQHLDAVNTEINRRSAEQSAKSNIELVKNSIAISEKSLALEASNNALAQQSLRLTEATLGATKRSVFWAIIAAIAAVISALYSAHIFH